MASKFNARKNFSEVEYSRVSSSPSKADLPSSKVPAFGELTTKNGTTPNYPKELNAVRLLLVAHLVLYYAHQVFGVVVFKNTLVERLAQWGAVQYSSLFCLEGFVLALKYGRNAAKSREQEMFINTSYFFKMQALEIFPIYLIATLAYFTLESMLTGITNWTQMFLSLTTIDAWLPTSASLATRDPTWAIGALLFFYLIFPPVVRLSSQASRNTLVQILLYTWLATTVPALAYVGFDVDISTVPLSVTFTTTSPLLHTGSFIFGIMLGLLYIKTDRESIPPSFASVMASLSALMLVIFFATTEIFDGRHVVWAQTGMFLPMLGFFFFFAAMGKDALLFSLFRTRAVSDNLGSIAMTAFVLERVFVGIAGQMLQSDTAGVFWVAFWSMLFIAAFFLNRFYSLIYAQQVLPWLSTQGSLHETEELSERSENPLQGWIWGDNFFSKAARLLVYYTGLGVTIAFYMVLALKFDWKGFASVHDIPALNLGVNFFKFCAMISLPSLGFSLIGHVLFPPVLRVKMPTLDYLKKNFKHKVYFRIVTRGKHPNLVRANVQHAAGVLRSILPFSQYVLEVATDNPLGLETACPGMATELLVPKEFAPTGGAKFKARALQYAIEASSAEPGDWIVHLDEETRFDSETVRGVLFHCMQEDEEIAKGRKQFGNIGQGVILYGTKEPDNWLTTLADSVRVGDDFGKFRIQYELHEPLIGMHGSFVVCQNAVERLVTFDHGMEGSITEDAYFALVAQVRGIKFSWIDSFMYEQSPFSCNDFMHQRCRWFAGLWLIVISKRIPFINRAVLLFFMFTWAATPLIWLAMTLCMVVSSSVPHWFRAVIGLISGMSTWGYILGFFFTFKPSQGIMRFVTLFALQLLLQPFFAAMELSGVFLGIVNPPTEGFHIVQKESSTLLKNIQASGEPSGVKKQPVSVELV